MLAAGRSTVGVKLRERTCHANSSGPEQVDRGCDRLASALEPYHLVVETNDAGWAAPFVARCPSALVHYLVHDDVADLVVAGNVPCLAELRFPESAPAVKVHEVALRGEPHARLQAEGRRRVELSLHHSQLAPFGLLQELSLIHI